MSEADPVFTTEGADEVPVLRMYAPQELRDYWPKVRQRIADIAAACGERWTAEDVYEELRLNERGGAGAFLWGTDDLSGFIVMQIIYEAHGRELGCWIVSNASGASPKDYFPQLVQIGHENECCRIVFENDRAGFQRHIPGLRMRFKYSFELS